MELKQPEAARDTFDHKQDSQRVVVGEAVEGGIVAVRKGGVVMSNESQSVNACACVAQEPVLLCWLSCFGAHSLQYI